MPTVVGIRFKKAGKIYYFDPGELAILANDHVIVETARGLEFGDVVIAPRDVAEKDIIQPLKPVLRLATAEDEQKVTVNRQKEKSAFTICEQKIAAHELPMNLVDVEYTFDVNKIIFYFTAEGRIDFRELVKDLASVFRTRIELRQIGVRDEAKMMGGIGCCGRPLCCSTFLGDFEPVSIRMAKDQNLSLNPTKISGICGRLMCCLKYESHCYCGHAKKVMAPKVGLEVLTLQGEGKVVSLNTTKKTAHIQLNDGKSLDIPWDEVVEKGDQPII
ncbi:MAG: stage 0 sporulation family protein [Sporomusaceae bacterium]|nr:stage 0 sporulation family protein [Sporomusaceae bacterium]